MPATKTLEEDILDVFYSSWRPLTVQEVWERLSDDGICVPILYLAKVIRILAESGYIKQASEIRGMEAYQVHSFWDRFKLRPIVSIVRGAVKVKQLPKIHPFKLAVVLVLLGSTSTFRPVYSEPVNATDMLTPVELEEQPIKLGQVMPDASTPSATTTASAPPIPPISTSRPSFTDAVTTVPQGSLQAENGATYTDNRGGTYSWTTPETLLRLGVLNNTEFRFTTPNYIYIGDNHPGSLANNFGDISVGLSQHLRLPGKVDMALIPILNIPTGANNVSSNSLDPQLRIVAGKSWTNKWFMSSHLDTRWFTGKDAAADVVFNPTFINYYSFTPKLTGFLEYSGFYPTKGKTIQFIQTGALYLLTSRQQLDARIAAGLNQNSPNILVGFGYSFRVDGLFGASKAFSSFK